MTDEDKDFEEMMAIAKSIAELLNKNEFNAYRESFACLVVAAEIIADLGPSTQRSAPERLKSLIKYYAVKSKKLNRVRAI